MLDLFYTIILTHTHTRTRTRTHTVLFILPLVPLTSDPDDPTPLTPSLLLTQKPQQVTGIPEILDSKNMYTKQWKRVQVLAQMFWKRWQSQYLQTLQSRQKWHKTERNISPGDVVLIRNKQTARNSWPLGIIQKIHSGSDNCVRSCEVRINRNGERSVLYTRPVTELVLLIPDNC